MMGKNKIRGQVSELSAPYSRSDPTGGRLTSGYLVRAFNSHPNRLRRLSIVAGRYPSYGGDVNET